MARIVFMGTPDFAAVVLEHMLAAGFRPVGVVTQPDRPAGRGNQLRPPPVKTLALEHDLPLAQPRKVRKGRLAAMLNEWEVDLAVVAAYGRILPPDALAAPALGCVNVHASLLPRYRGAAPIHRAILNGDAETGVSLMRMSEGLDEGPVFATQATPIHPEDTAETLHDRLAVMGGELLVARLPELLAGALEATPQEDMAATFAPPLRKEEGLVSWDRPAQAIADQVRGLYPWPGAFTSLEDRRIKLFPPVEPVVGARPGPPPGEIVAVDDAALTVACGDGAVRVRELQEAGRKRMSVAMFLRGRPVVPGARLGPAD